MLESGELCAFHQHAPAKTQQNVDKNATCEDPKENGSQLSSLRVSALTPNPSGFLLLDISILEMLPTNVDYHGKSM